MLEWCRKENEKVVVFSRRKALLVILDEFLQKKDESSPAADDEEVRCAFARTSDRSLHELLLMWSLHPCIRH
ncbi:hypothetical protein CBR_g53665 [Chara braunii]|uniref:Uncharacterized protein n=1 Tax=Chara braunii TaxID=69332 RepID=A0A388MB36_CHABU|nr:hypothetical protein CBR_g53665 [Chara braunii]|eukprot:GBG91776.1 hypothetical protein CBR_g53665 [Chara braunii]